MAYTRKLQSKVLEREEVEKRYEGYKENTIMNRNVLKKKESEEEMCKDMEEVYEESE